MLDTGATVNLKAKCCEGQQGRGQRRVLSVLEAKSLDRRAQTWVLEEPACLAPIVTAACLLGVTVIPWGEGLRAPPSVSISLSSC